VVEASLKRSLSYDIVFMTVQQLAALAIHERFFVRNHILLVAIRPEECLRLGDVIEPNLRDTIEVRGCCSGQALTVL
jgi:hypothetical protein